MCISIIHTFLTYCCTSRDSRVVGSAWWADHRTPWVPSSFYLYRRPPIVVYSSYGVAVMTTLDQRTQWQFLCAIMSSPQRRSITDALQNCVHARRHRGNIDWFNYMHTDGLAWAVVFCCCCCYMLLSVGEAVWNGNCCTVGQPQLFIVPAIRSTLILVSESSMQSVRIYNCA